MPYFCKEKLTTISGTLLESIFCKMGKTGLCLITILFTQYLSAQTPVNDECSAAILLSVNPDNSCNNIYKGNTGYSTQSRPSCVYSGYDAKDVWFKFVASSSTHRITVTPINYENYVFQVYSGTCDNLESLACVNTGSTREPDVVLLNTLTAGNTYYIRLYDYYGGGSIYREFSICISTTTTLVNNDDCGGAENVVPSANINPPDPVVVNNTGATQSMPGCYGTADDDIWFKFTATSARHTIKVTTENDINPVLEVFSGNCAALTSISCRYNSSSLYYYIDIDLNNLVPGTTYYYRVYGNGSNNRRTNISTFIITPPAAPPNDECSGAIMLNVNPDNSCNSIYTGNTGYSTESLPSCVYSGYDARDVWFKFIATSSTHRITVTPINYENYVFEVYSGTCGNLVSLECVNTGLPREPDVVLLNSLIAGNTYYIRLYDYYGGGSIYREFSICISNTNTTLNNDECSGAATVVPSPNFNPPDPVVINNTGATQSMPGCHGTAEDDIWFKFTATSARHTIIVTTENDINPVLEVFSGNCASLMSLTCRHTPTGTYFYIDADLSNLLKGTTYYYRVYGSGSNNIKTNISTYIITPPPVPPNDECNGAIMLNINPDNSCNNIYSGSTGFSTQSLPSCVNSGYDARDVWFKFVASSTTHRITVTPINYEDYAFEVYSGTCGSLLSLACVNTGSAREPDVVLLNTLTAGNTYYIRLYDFYGGGSVTREFSICISTTNTTVNNDDCSGAITVVPSFDNNIGNAVVVNNTGATQSLEGCFGTAEDDIWFKFTATSTRHVVKISTENSINPVLEVFKGNCAASTSITCRYFPLGEAYSFVEADLTNLQAGTTYYYRVYGSSTNNLRTNISNYIITIPQEVIHICPGGSNTLVSTLAGSTYQWQVNTGNGFIDISNNSNYSGVNNKILQISNIPSTWYGNQYRCKVDGAFSMVITIKFTNFWTGKLSSAWENPGNWSCGSIPDIHTDVNISSGTILVNSDGRCRALLLANGVSFTINAANSITVSQ